jgi:hypothetical protein
MQTAETYIMTAERCTVLQRISKYKYLLVAVPTYYVASHAGIEVGDRARSRTAFKIRSEREDPLWSLVAGIRTVVLCRE